MLIVSIACLLFNCCDTFVHYALAHLRTKVGKTYHKKCSQHETNHRATNCSEQCQVGYRTPKIKVIYLSCKRTSISSAYPARKKIDLARARNKARNTLHAASASGSGEFCFQSGEWQLQACQG